MADLPPPGIDAPVEAGGVRTGNEGAHLSSFDEARLLPRALSLDDRLLLFSRMKATHTVVCSVGILTSLLAVLLAPGFLFGGISLATIHVCLLVSRLYVARERDQKRALRLFGYIWLGAAIFSTTSFILVQNKYGMVEGTSNSLVYTITFSTIVSATYVHVSGVEDGPRAACNLVFAASAVIVRPWTVMDRHLVVLITWMALLVGEMLGGILVGIILRCTRGPQLAPFRSARFQDHEPSKAPPGVSSSAPMLKDILSVILARGTGEGRRLDPLRMDAITLSFEEPSIEILYATNTQANSGDVNLYVSMAAVLVAAFCAYSSPCYRRTGIAGTVFFTLVWYTHERVQGWHGVPRAYLTLCKVYSRLSILMSCLFAMTSLFHAGRSSLPWHSLKTCGVKHHQEAGLDTAALLPLNTVDATVGALCGALLLFIAGAQFRLVMLPPPMRMTTRVLLLGNVLLSHFDASAELFLPSTFHDFVLASGALFVGELVGYSVDHVRRKLFCDLARELHQTSDHVARAQQRIERMQADAAELERKNASHCAELQADKRLNHVIKGRCGSAISAVETFNQLLGPYLKADLPEEMANLLVAPLAHLREAIEWCHRRQVFVQIEEMTYVSRHTPVEINPLLEARLAASGSLFSNVDEPLALDETVLKICLDEVISNALKYRRMNTPVRMEARFADGMLHVAVQNANPADCIPLSPEECERVMLPGHKAHTCSALSDGLGLDSVSCAVRAAGGSAWLEQNAECTTFQLKLPATVRKRANLGCEATPEETLSVSRRSVVQYASQDAANSLRRTSSGFSCVASIWPGTGPTLDASEQMPSPMTRTSSSAPTRASSAVVFSPYCGPVGHETRSGRLPSDLESCTLKTLSVPSPKCVGLIDDEIKSVFLSFLFSDRLKASQSAVLAATPSECREFVDKVMSKPDEHGRRHDLIDIVAMSYVLRPGDRVAAPLLGVQMALRLRAHGYRGLICILVDQQTELQIEELCMQTYVDIVVPKSALVQDVGERLLSRHEMKVQPLCMAPYTLHYTATAMESKAVMQEKRNRIASLSRRGSAKGADLLAHLSHRESDTADDAERVPQLSRHASGRGAELFGCLSRRASSRGAELLAHLSRSASLRGDELVASLGPSASSPASELSEHRNPDNGRRDSINVGLIAGQEMAGGGDNCPSCPQPDVAGDPPLHGGPPSPKEAAVLPCAEAAHPPSLDMSSLAAPGPFPSIEAVDELEAEFVPAPALRVVGLDDEKIPRMIQGMFMRHQLGADMRTSCVLGETKEEVLAFVDVAMGILNSDLTPNLGEQRQADVVILDENIVPPQILGSIVATQLRSRGFTGIVVILTGASSSNVKAIQAIESVDLAFEKGTPLSKMATAILMKLSCL